MREAHVHGDRPAEAIVTGFRYSARVVVAAALIMMAVFSGFVGAQKSMIKMIGFGLAIAVLFDAFVVRMAIVPAVLALMKTSVQTGVVGALVCGTLAATLAFGRHDEGGGLADDAAPPKGPYVALGDSYTAGPRIPDQTGTLELLGADFRDMSCSGAAISDLTSSQSTDDGVNPAQLSALSADTRLVTIGIGGNDIGFASLVRECVTARAIYQAMGSGTYVPDDAPCSRRYVSGGTDEVQENSVSRGFSRVLMSAPSPPRRLPPRQLPVTTPGLRRCIA